MKLLKTDVAVQKEWSEYFYFWISCCVLCDWSSFRFQGGCVLIHPLSVLLLIYDDSEVVGFRSCCMFANKKTQVCSVI